METSDNVKKMVKEKYGQIALQSYSENAGSCCGAGGCGTVDYTVFSDDYSKLDGYNPDADLALGCGIPTEFAQIREGYTVVDLGSGAGNDAFVARKLVGPKGRVIGIDMTEAMIEKANINTKKLGFTNMDFRLGDIENMPVEDNSTDVVISNCVLNLVPDKNKAFSEIFRILKPGAHFSISDVVLEGTLPPAIESAAVMYAGCISGALQKKDYTGIIDRTGFTETKIQKQKQIHVPDSILREYLSERELEEFQKSGASIISITVFGKKPA
ncbi:arsenite methyltransferase [bacterium]|nr:MAG: arsenite methyltransferase [bacterium]